MRDDVAGIPLADAVPQKRHARPPGADIGGVTVEKSVLGKMSNGMGCLADHYASERADNNGAPVSGVCPHVTGVSGRRVMRRPRRGRRAPSVRASGVSASITVIRDSM